MCDSKQVKCERCDRCFACHIMSRPETTDHEFINKDYLRFVEALFNAAMDGAIILLDDEKPEDENPEWLKVQEENA